MAYLGIKMIVKKNNIQFPKCYAARSNNDDVIYNSSSGGIFTEIAYGFYLKMELYLEQ